MKNSLIALAVALFSLNVFSQTGVVVTPVEPVYCSQRDYAAVNSIYDVETFENAELIEVKFKTSHGDCVSGQFIKVKTNMHSSSIDFSKERISFPWSYTPVYTYVELNETDVEITVTFNKAVTFKKSLNRKFTLKFTPVNRNFSWNFNLSYNKLTDSTKLLLN